MLWPLQLPALPGVGGRPPGQKGPGGQKAGGGMGVYGAPGGAIKMDQKEVRQVTISQILEALLQTDEKELPGKLLLFSQLSGCRPKELLRILQEVNG